eukprot:TRINITY_DN3063_c0_g1_i1.p1 TRINITY_DN3063_c0_g1~~TRINITY_DN3063_c0_g1_i1.p1  ORF type:complete len:375 (+),score=102.84 TRINITY_DN3063_c0_g1_i1:347-1471(+)
MKNKLAKALREAGLEKYKDVLEEAEITDPATLSALTEEDWGEIVSDDGDKERFVEVMERLKRKKKVKEREAWKPPGRSATSSATRGVSPNEEAVKLDGHRAHLRKQKEILGNPTSTAAERHWANTAVCFYSTDPAPPVSFTGARALLRLGDTVRVISSPAKLWKCIGAIASKAHPHAALMCGKTGEIMSLEGDAFTVKFREGTIKVPPDGLELLATKYIPKDELAKLLEKKPPAPAKRKARKNTAGPEVVGTTTPSRGGTPAPTPPAKGKKKTAWKDPPPVPTPAEPLNETARLRAELHEARTKLHRTQAVQTELKQLLTTFIGISQTLGTSSTLWAQQLAECNPQSAALATELSTANTSLAERLVSLEKEMSF